MFAVTGKYAFPLCKNGKKPHDYETYLSEKGVSSMEIIFERTSNGDEIWTVLLNGLEARGCCGSRY